MQPLKRVILSLFFLLVSPVFSFSTVVIDPGHGGRDGGAYRYGVKESDLNLKVARLLRNELQKKGVRVVMTRNSDIYLSLRSRANIANRYPNSIFVSIHFNAHKSTYPKGIETFYASKTGARIAAQIQSRLASGLKSRNRGIKFNSKLGVLTATNAPATLVECGFISNYQERRRCVTSWYQTIAARKIAEGLLAYKKAR